MAILTEKGDFFVLSYVKASSSTNQTETGGSSANTSASGELVTLVHANVNSADCLPSRTAQFVSIDIENQMILIHCSIGIVQLINYEIRGEEIYFKKSFPLKVMELEIVDISFVDSIRPERVPTVAILHRLPMKLPRVKTYEIIQSGNSYTFTSNSYSMTDLSIDTSQMVRVPHPRGGFLILSPERIIYTNPRENILRKLVFISTYFTAVTCIDSDGFRFLLSSSSGELFILLLLTSSSSASTSAASSLVTDIKYEKLGKTSIASCITYIDDGYVYIGSQHGDSQLIQLTSDSVNKTDPQFLRVIETYPSLAPITDFCMIKSNKMSDQNILIAAGGSAKDGALKVISSGIEAITLLSADLVADDNSWPIIPASSIFSFKTAGQNNHTHLVMSTLGQTCTYRVDLTKMSLEEIAWGLNSTVETLHILQLSSGHLPQVTSHGIYLGFSGATSSGGMWNCNPNEKIILAANFQEYILLGLSDFTIKLFHVTATGFTIVASAQFTSEVSCLNIFKGPGGLLMAAVGFWDMKSFGFLHFNPKDKSIKFVPINHPIATESILRSVQILESPTGSIYALFGSGNGKVFVCKIEETSVESIGGSSTTTTSLKEEDFCILKLGKGPISLFKFDDRHHLIARGEVPYYISWHKDNRLIYSVINNIPPTFDSFVQFNFGDQVGFVTVSGSSLQFSYLSQTRVPKVNIKNIPVGKSVHKLIHLPRARVLAAILHNFPIMMVPMSHWPLLKSELVLFDDESFEILDRYELKSSPNDVDIGRFTEIGWSLATGPLEGLSGEESLVLGTSLTNDDPKAEKGRLLLFQIGEGKRLRMISSNELNGGVKSVSILRGYVIGCVRGLNVVYKWDYQLEKKLIKASSSGGHIDGTCIALKDNILAIGDSLTSVSFCHFNPNTLKISEFARDFQDNYITSVQLVDHASAIASDLTGNLITLQVIRDDNLDFNAASCEGNIHLGDQINTILPGNFRSKPDAAVQSFILVTSTGALHTLHQIPSTLYKKLLQLQKNLIFIMKPVGGVKHSEFRRFFNGERHLKASQGFIDGDLLVRFLGLTATAKNEALGVPGSKSSNTEKIDMKVEEVVKIIESLSFGI